MTSLPAIKPFRGGRSSCPPFTKRVSPVRSRGYDKLDSALRNVVDKAVAEAAPETQLGARVAKHIEAFHVDNQAEVTASLCEEWIRSVLCDFDGAALAMTKQLAIATLMSVDQLLALLVKHEPTVRNISTLVRSALHRCVLTVQKDTDELPRLLSAASATEEEELRDEYRGKTFFFDATVSLMSKNAKLEDRCERLQRSVNFHQRATLFLQHQQRKVTLSKAFAGWRLQVRRDREEQSHRASAVEVEAESLQLRHGLAASTSLHEVQVRGLRERIELLENERRTLHKNLDTQTTLNLKLRGNFELLQRHVWTADAERESQSNTAEMAAAWKRTFTEQRRLACDNAFENFNRGRVQQSVARVLTDGVATGLFRWCENMVDIVPEGKRCVFGKVEDHSTIASYITVLYCMNPGGVPRAAVTSAFGSRPSVQSEALSAIAKDMDIHTATDVAQLFAAQQHEHILFLASAFARFCGVGGQLPFLPSRDPKEALPWTKLQGYLVAEPEYSSAEEAERRQTFRIRELGRTLSAGAEVFASAAKFAVGAAAATRREPVDHNDVTRSFSTLVLPNNELSADEKASVEVGVLIPCASRLRQVFFFYAGGGFRVDLDLSMNVDEFTTLLCDARVIGTRLAESDIEPLFMRFALTGDTPALHPPQFVAALVYAATVVHTANEAPEWGKLTSSEKVREFIENYVLAFCSGVALDQFREVLRSKPVQDEFASSRAQLRKLFKCYAQTDNTASGEGTDLALKEFQRLCADAKVIDEVCTHAAVEQVFWKIPDPLGASTTSAARSSAMMRTKGLQYGPFEEALFGLAWHKFPSPIVAPHQKLRRFIDSFLVLLANRK